MPTFAAIPACPKVSRGRTEGKATPLAIDIERMAIDEVVARLRWQSRGDAAEVSTTVLGLEHTELALARDPELVLLGRDEPGSLGVLGMGGDGEAEGL